MNNMNKPAMNLQDSFLNHVRKENLGVVIYLMNGFQLRGLVRGFDNFTVIIGNINDMLFDCKGKGLSRPGIWC